MAKHLNAGTLMDYYKVSHKAQYPDGTDSTYGNLTPRSFRLFKGGRYFNNLCTVYGVFGAVKILVDLWDDTFFNRPKDVVINEIKRRHKYSIGEVDIKHFEDLHDLGYLPILIKTLEEGSLVPEKTPVFTIQGTNQKFPWVSQMLETALSSEVWKPMVVATVTSVYYNMCKAFSDKTCDDDSHLMFQCHDFSMRGLGGLSDWSTSGHLLYFKGTDTIPAIDFLEYYYNADVEQEPVGFSVPATEHSVMCMGTKEDEVETFRRMLKIYPDGIVSIVSDTWDFWNVITNTASTLKDEIEARDGKVVFRPDSGNPTDIICGTYRQPSNSQLSSPQEQGAIECLWDTFGGTINEKGYKVLNPKVGLIYGDSITIERAQEILERLEAKGFASSNIVFGVGSFSYQYLTRDTLGIAMKATYGVVKGEGREIFKDPITDSGVKKSAKGLLKVEKEQGLYVTTDQCTPQDASGGLLKPLFLDGSFIFEPTFGGIQVKIQKELEELEELKRAENCSN